MYQWPWLVAAGVFLFRFRNALFPALMLAVLVPLPPALDGLLHLQSGLALAAAGQALRVATIGLAYIVRGGRNKRVYADGLVTAGLFGVCRNPLYLGNMLIYVGLCVFHGSPWTIGLGTAAFAVCYCAIVAAEERYLRDRYGESYERYCRDVARWLPRPALLPKATRGLRFQWGRVVCKDYSTAAAWMLGALAIEAWRRWLWLDGSNAVGEALRPLGWWLGLTLMLLAAAWTAKKAGWLRERLA